MKLLLDTHLLLWAAGKQSRLSSAARALILDRSNVLHFSTASLWEIAIKNSLHRQDFDVDTQLLRHSLLVRGYKELNIIGDHAIAVGRLPAIHRDPLDRILVAQAQVESLTLLTADPVIAQYKGPVQQV